MAVAEKHDLQVTGARFAAAVDHAGRAMNGARLVATHQKPCRIRCGLCTIGGALTRNGRSATPSQRLQSAKRRLPPGGATRPSVVK